MRDVNTPDYPILLVQYGLKNKIRCPAQDAAYIETQEVHPHKNSLNSTDKSTGCVLFLLQVYGGCFPLARDGQYSRMGLASD